jgi:hypothetical protein
LQTLFGCSPDIPALAANIVIYLCCFAALSDSLEQADPSRH